MNITIQNEFASVTCRTLGAELLSYKTAAGKEYMWQKDPAYWAKTSPVLFPYIGAVPETVTIHGVDYKIPRHGFVKTLNLKLPKKVMTMSFSPPEPMTIPHLSIHTISVSPLPSVWSRQSLLLLMV